MPKKPSIKKGAAALYQNSMAIERAWKHDVVFGAVTKRLGNGAFNVMISDKKSIMATPRGLFTKGSMPIAVGQVVIVVGTDRMEGDNRSSLPWEIVARLDETTQIKDLIEGGRMPAEILALASTAGAVDSGANVADEDLFESDASDEAFWEKGVADVRGGMKEQRKAQETKRTIASRIASLQAGRKGGLDGGVTVGDLADPTLFTDANLEKFKRWRASKPKAVTMSVGGTVVEPAPMEEPVALPTLYSAQAEVDEHLRIADIKAFLAMQPVKDNWDDEIDINDL